MKAAMIGLIAGAGFMLMAGEWRPGPEARAQRPVSGLATAAGPMVSHTSALSNGTQQVTVIDPQSHVMGVYHVDPETGRISLKSIRNIHWDFLMEEFNGVSPSPREIQSMLQRR